MGQVAAHNLPESIWVLTCLEIVIASRFSGVVLGEERRHTTIIESLGTSAALENSARAGRPGSSQSCVKNIGKTLIIGQSITAVFKLEMRRKSEMT